MLWDFVPITILCCGSQNDDDDNDFEIVAELSRMVPNSFNHIWFTRKYNISTYYFHSYYESSDVDTAEICNDYNIFSVFDISFVVNVACRSGRFYCTSKRRDDDNQTRLNLKTPFEWSILFVSRNRQFQCTYFQLFRRRQTLITKSKVGREFQILICT